MRMTVSIATTDNVAALVNSNKVTNAKARAEPILRFKEKMMKKTISFTLVLSTLTLLSACASRPLLEERQLAQPLPPVEKPSWKVGHVQVVQNNQTGEENSWEILSVDDEGRVTARSNNGCKWTVPGEWFAGVERWENCGGSDGIRELVASEGSLWPLKVGNRSSYRYQLKPEKGDAHPERVKCSVVSEARVTVLLGDMDVFRVECVRTNEWSRETRTWYWSPELGEVKYLRHDSKKGVRRDVDVLQSGFS